MLIYRQRSSVFRASFPTYSIRVPRVTLSIQTGYTSTASRVDNDKQIPQLLFIVLSRCSTIVVLQQTQESAVVITSRNNSNPVATSIQSQHFKAQNRYVITNSNDVVTSHQLISKRRRLTYVILNQQTHFNTQQVHKPADACRLLLLISSYDKFNKMSFVKADMMYNCLESVKYDNQNSSKLSENGKAGIGFSKPERFKPNWLKNRLDKDKAKAGQKPFVPNQSWHNSKKVKSGWKKFQQRRDQHDQSMKPKLKRPARDFAHTFVDPRTGKTVRIIQIWVPKGVIQSGPK
ncbi:hypothetical protein F511_31858 [Dorcoceras hygrometricum]|uniref:Uncharacterized protein n=1 Tax=Dorcoceras hygrometricum TaxID=472368 RepID=A0A2Z7DKI7_9LAMI|nr:hypothetical protein F511_31858 [Dorcoceras hygrometricum]